MFSFTGSLEVQQSVSQPSSYNFQYPTSFIPIPYHTDTTLPMLHSHIVPLARSTREILVDIPTSTPFRFPPSSYSAMPIDSGADHSGLTTVPVHITSDGLLLYVSHASYEEGISPLSCWIPIRAITIPGEQGTSSSEQESNGPLDLFQRYVKCVSSAVLHLIIICGRLVHRRLARVQQSSESQSDGMVM